MSEKVKNEVVRPVSRMRHWRQRYEKGAEYIWRRSVTWQGEQTVVGSKCPDSLTANPKKLRLFWEAKTIELMNFDGNNPKKKHLRQDGTAKPDGQTPAPVAPTKPATAEDLVSGSGRKWAVKGSDETFTSKGAATAAAKAMLEKAAADAAAKKVAEEAAAAEKAKEEQSEDPTDADGEGQEDETVLLGSDVQPDHVEIKEGVTVSLGEVVVFAHKASELSVADWNALDSADREARLEQAIVDMGKVEETDPLED